MAHATTSIASALARAMLRHERVLAKRLPAALTGDVKAVHRARVASRRLREVLAVAVEVNPTRGAERVQREVRRVTRALGPVREIDVALQEMDRAARRLAWPPDRFAALRRALEKERERRSARMATKAAGFDREWLRDRCQKLADGMAAITADRDWWRALASRIVQRSERVRAAVAECGTLYSPDRLHALRIAVKKLRYALEFVLGTPGLEVAPAVAALRRAQQRFGHLHDVQILLAQVQALAAAGRPTAANAGYAKIVESLERDCREIHARALPHLPEIERFATATRRELGARRRSRRLTMAKAQTPGEELTARGLRLAARNPTTRVRKV